MKSKKKMRWNRIIMLFITLIFCLSFSVNAFGETKGNYSYVDVKVQYGDSLWQLIQEYNPQYSGNMSEAVYNVKDINNLKTSCLQNGQILRIPVDL